MPNETGTAIQSAMKEVSKVPAMGTNAPYSLLTGSQLFVQRKEKPYSAMDSRLTIDQGNRDGSQQYEHEKRKRACHVLENAVHKGVLIDFM